MERSATARWIDGMAQVLIGATAVVAACIALTGTGFAQRAETPGARLRAAMETYQSKMWPQAYAQLSALADAGDPAAARVAAMMARQGPLLFGQRFDVTPARLARWDLAMRGVKPGDDGARAPRPVLTEGVGGLGPERPNARPLVASAPGEVTFRGTSARTGGSQPAVLVAGAK